MITYIALLLCISPIATEHDRNMLAREAVKRGYDVHLGTSPVCIVEAMPGLQDLTYAEIWTFREPLTVERANDLVTAWEARFW